MLCGFALLGGLLQIAASIKLGLARLHQLEAAALEGSMFYVLGAFAAVLGLTVVWFLRRRPVVAVVALLAWQAAVLLPLRTKTTSLGLSYHGEYILHHFTALVAGAAVLVIARGLQLRRELGRGRTVVAGGAAAATVLLLVVHVWREPGIGATPPAALQQIGAALALATWLGGVAVFWARLGPLRVRVVSVALVVPYLVRVAFAWPEGLVGASVIDAGRPVLMAVMVVAALVTFVGFRPRLPPTYLALVAGLAGILTWILYVAYTHRFGDYEAGLGGLVQSTFAFTPPYPTYVADWKIITVLMGTFGAVSAAYAGLITPGHRARGVALALLLTAGLGLSTPGLALMTLAAGLCWVDAGTHGPSGPTESIPAPVPVEVTLQALADALGLAAPVVLETERGTVAAVRGELEDVTIDVRARPVGAAGLRWDVEMQLGVLGRQRATIELVPDTGGGGTRPPHAIGQTHRSLASLRALEAVDDRLLDALVPFASAHTELWPDGSRVRFGGDLSHLRCAELASLARALARRA